MNEFFGSLAGGCFDYRWVVVALFMAIAAGAVAMVSNARIDNSYEAYFAPSDETYQAYETYREDFGSDEVSYILYEVPGVEHGPWNIDVMRSIVGLTEALEDEVPFVYDVKTVANAELTQGVPDGIDIQKITDEFPETQAELLALRDAYLEKDLLVGGIISEDATHAAIIIKMDRSSTDPPDMIRVDPEKGDELENLYPQATETAIEAILARPEYAEIQFYHSGDVPLNSAYNRIIGGESQKLDAITSGVIAIILLITFRSVLAAVAPIVVVQISVLLCISLIVAMGWKLDMSFGSAPTLLTAIGVAHSVHILSEFRTQYRGLGDRRAALVRTLYLVGAPCLLTSLTTAVGFASMSSAPIMSIAHSGVYNAFGVMAALVMSLTLFMALLSMGRRELAGISAVLGALIGFALTGAVESLVVSIPGALAAGAACAFLVMQFF
ncbi:MAG: MMPL family transporter, partial [Polyangiaceae bacterium]